MLHKVNGLKQNADQVCMDWKRKQLCAVMLSFLLLLLPWIQCSPLLHKRDSTSSINEHFLSEIKSTCSVPDALDLSSPGLSMFLSRPYVSKECLGFMSRNMDFFDASAKVVDFSLDIWQPDYAATFESLKAFLQAKKEEFTLKLYVFPQFNYESLWKILAKAPVSTLVITFDRSISWIDESFLAALTGHKSIRILDVDIYLWIYESNYQQFVQTIKSLPFLEDLTLSTHDGRSFHEMVANNCKKLSSFGAKGFDIKNFPVLQSLELYFIEQPALSKWMDSQDLSRIKSLVVRVDILDKFLMRSIAPLKENLHSLELFSLGEDMYPRQSSTFMSKIFGNNKNLKIARNPHLLALGFLHTTPIEHLEAQLGYSEERDIYYANNLYHYLLKLSSHSDNAAKLKSVTLDVDINISLTMPEIVATVSDILNVLGSLPALQDIYLRFHGLEPHLVNIGPVDLFFMYIQDLLGEFKGKRVRLNGMSADSILADAALFSQRDWITYGDASCGDICRERMLFP